MNRQPMKKKAWRVFLNPHLRRAWEETGPNAQEKATSPQPRHRSLQSPHSATSSLIQIKKLTTPPEN